MNKAIIFTAALLVASPAFAQGGSTKSQGATKYAPGQQMHKSTKSTAPGASEYAPGHQKNTAAGPGHSESAPGQRMKSQTTTGSNTGKRY
ncbi:MAG TPA: hypothetical protein VJR30_10665 [Bradyrhizobium sp.]|nr:hypothetical protein [Bradyrhizobium sp.]